MDNARFFVPVDPWQKAFVIFGLFYILPCMLYLPEYLPSPAYTGTGLIPFYKKAEVVVSIKQAIVFKYYVRCVPRSQRVCLVGETSKSGHFQFRRYLRVERTTQRISFHFFFLPPSVSYGAFLYNSGYFGNFLLYLREHHYGLVELLFFGSVLIHLLEASCALVFCIYLEVDAPTTARWVWSAALYGGFSLVHLVRRLYQDEMDREPSKEKVDWHKLE